MPHPGGSPLPPAQRAVDRLGDLPTEVLEKLLGRLPARDVVRTSVLARPWRRRWELVPCLDVELHGLRDDAGTWRSATRFLYRCASPVGRVSIRGVPLSFSHRVDHWVRIVAGKSLRSLSLALPAVALRSLFRCDAAALAELEIQRCAIPAPPPRFAGFHRLVKLDLDDVVFTGENAWSQLEAMVSAAAPTLVELRLQNIAFLLDDAPAAARGWAIRAPNLRRLVLCLWMGPAALWELGPLPNLELARIFLHDSAEERDYVQMFAAISNVTELHLGNFHMATQVAAINIFKDLLCRFKNLRILRVDGNFNESATNHLLYLSPYLETFEIKVVLSKVHKIEE